MSAEAHSPIEPLIAAILNRITPALTQGLTPEQARWALDAYRSTVLPHRLRFGIPPGDAGGEGLAALVVRDLTSKFGALNPSDRWDAIVEDYYFARLSPLSEAAFNLAQEAYTGKRQREELRPEAEDIVSRLQNVTQEMKDRAPSALEALDEEVSETVMDCDYVIHGGDLLSLRMGRWI